jgi:hypothetical protein
VPLDEAECFLDATFVLAKGGRAEIGTTGIPLCFDFYMIEILPTTGPLGVPRHNFLGSSSSPVSLSSSGERVQHMFESHAAC